MEDERKNNIKKGKGDKNKMKKYREERGITLIALIISIIIMVILAAVSINSIYNMAIVDKSIQGVQKYAGESVKENQMMDNTVGLLDNTVKKINKITGNYEISVSAVTSSTAPKLADLFNEENSEYTWQDVSNIAKKLSETEGVTKETQGTLEIDYGGDKVTIAPGDIFNLKDTYGSTYKVRVLGFNSDKLVGDPYGNGKQYAGISFEFVDFLKEYKETTDPETGDKTITPVTTHQMRTNNTNTGGWGAANTTMRTYLNPSDTTAMTGVNILENKEYIKTVEKIYNTGGENYNEGTSISNDDLWLLACSEIWGARTQNINDVDKTVYGYCMSNESTMPEGIETTQYAYYAKYTTANDRKKPNTTNGRWWLRSPFYNIAGNFCLVNNSGTCNNGYASGSTGVAPGFSI